MKNLVKECKRSKLDNLLGQRPFQRFVIDSVDHVIIVSILADFEWSHPITLSMVS